MLAMITIVADEEASNATVCIDCPYFTACYKQEYAVKECEIQAEYSETPEDFDIHRKWTSMVNFAYADA